MTNIQAINPQQHMVIKIADNRYFKQSKAQHFAPLVVQEFTMASHYYPIVFIKNADTGEFKAVALLGLKPGQNLFYSDQGWRADYVPKVLELYPFVLHHEQDSSRSMVCIDSDSGLVNEQHGEPLFDAQGQQTQWLTNKAEQLVVHVENNYLTQHFIQSLLSHGLLIAQTLTLQLPNQEPYELNGLYVINEQALNQLPEAGFLTLRKTGALPAIYAVLNSMSRIEQLAKLS